MTAVPVSMVFVFAPTAARSGKRRRQLPRKVVDAEIRAVRTEFFGGNGKIDGLEQRVTRGAGF